MRLSNYLIWQAAYAEYYSTPTLWPDFVERDFTEALDAYASRKRRFGKTDAQIAAEADAKAEVGAEAEAEVGAAKTAGATASDTMGANGNASNFAGPQPATKGTR